MDLKSKRKALEDFASKVSKGDLMSADMVSRSSSNATKALQARDLAEDSLANEVLKKTGVPIPGKGATTSQLENFMGDLLKERYPELENKGIEVRPLKRNMGSYNLDSGIIQLDSDLVKEDPIKATSTLLHESAHKYDNEFLKKPITKDMTANDILKISAKESAKGKIDPTELYELIAKGHHQKIPNLREGSFGLGALKSMLKSGTFKGVAPLLGKAAAAGAGGALSLASEAADSEETGDAPEQNALLREIDERSRRSANPDLAPLYENIDKNSRVSPQDTLKINALKKLAGK